jgi:GNAT superfamily N-acetyltransferase
MIDFFDTYYMAGMAEEIVPQQTFFRDRFFGETDVFATDKVIAEFMDGDRRMAPFVAPRAGDIPIARRGFELDEFTPPYIAPSRFLTMDDLRKRGFGEALYANSTPADRARALQLRDLTDLTNRITRREEWMAVQTMINNGLVMQEYIDASTTGETLQIYFYDTAGSNPALYTISANWTTWALFESDVEAMCDQLAQRGLPVEDLFLGSSAAKAVMAMETVQKMLDIKNLNIGQIAPQVRYPGVTYIGQLVFGGYTLNIWSVKEQYVNDSGTTTPYFPAKSAMVTAPGCGHSLYGAVTQINYGETEPATIAQARVPKLVIDQDKDTRKLRLASRPLTAPKNKAPWIYAANVIA